MKEERVTALNFEIKCDNPECDFRQKLESPNYEEWLNVPCPECGENLLTEQDFNNWKAVRKAMDLVNSMSDEQIDNLTDSLKDLNTDIDYLNGKQTIQVETHKEIKLNGKSLN